MTTLVRNQSAFDEEQLDDPKLLQLIEERKAAADALVDAKGYLDDYCESMLADGIYRVGKYRLTIRHKWGVSVREVKGRR